MTKKETVNTPSILVQIWGQPRAKPWDYVKGRRFKCCGEVKPRHWRYCALQTGIAFLRISRGVA